LVLYFLLWSLKLRGSMAAVDLQFFILECSVYNFGAFGLLNPLVVEDFPSDLLLSGSAG